MSPVLKIGPHSFENALVLAPMEDVSSAPFRALCRRFGADLVYTEFVHAQLLVNRTRESVAKIRIHPGERPTGIQIFGEDPHSLAEAARIALESEPDVIDLNIGCPVRKVVGKGAGAALLRDLPLTERIVRAIKKVVPVPLTAKARVGWDADSIIVAELARMLEANGVAALTVHARTREQGYQGAADWTWIRAARKAVKIPIIGNGDVLTPDAAKRMLEETGCHGVMLGRAAIGNPWIFRQIRRFLETGERVPEPTPAERMDVLIEHLEAAAAEKGERRAVVEMRRQYAPYLQGFSGAAGIRRRLLGVERLDDVRQILADALTGPALTADPAPA